MRRHRVRLCYGVGLAVLLVLVAGLSVTGLAAPAGDTATTPNDRVGPATLGERVAPAEIGERVGPAATTDAADETDHGDGAVAITTGNATVAEDGSTTVELFLTEAPEGLAGFQLTVELPADGVAAVTDASYPAQYGLTTDPVVSTDRQSVTLEAADLSGQVEAGATGVRLASVTVSGNESGRTPVELADVQVDTDEGTRLDPAVDTGAVIVGQEAAGADTTAESTDSDGTAAPAGETSTSGPAALTWTLFGVIAVSLVVIGLAVAVRRGKLP